MPPGFPDLGSNWLWEALLGNILDSELTKPERLTSDYQCPTIVRSDFLLLLFDIF